MAVTFRIAEPKDVARLAQIFWDCRQAGFEWLEHQTMRRDDFQRETEGELVVVAVDENQLILGYVSVWTPENFIHHLFVHPEHQRRGVGPGLIQSLFARVQGPYRLKCGVQNVRALRFYEREGWQQIQRGTGPDGEYLLLEFLPPPLDKLGDAPHH